MGKVNRLFNRVEPFADLFWAISALYLPTPDPARHHSTAVHKACPYIVIVVSILNKDSLAPLPLFLSRYVIYLCQGGAAAILPSHTQQSVCNYSCRGVSSPTKVYILISSVHGDCRIPNSVRIRLGMTFRICFPIWHIFHKFLRGIYAL